MLSTLFSNPAEFFRLSLYRIPILLLSLCLHEWGHAYVAYRCGDPTARNMGRLTLDPRRHLDPVGTLLMLTVGFGWAKPVPVNPNNYHNRIPDDVKVSLAGITINLMLFLLFTAIAVSLNSFLWQPHVISALGGPKAFLSLTGYNASLVFGVQDAADLFQHTWLVPVVALATLGAQMNLMLAIFNLLPIPPLDGYHVVNDLVLKGRLYISPQVAQIGIYAIMLISFATPILSNVMIFLASHAQGAVLNVFLMLTGR